MAFDEGPLQTREQVFERAEEGFNFAISLAQATGNEEVDYLALEGHRHTDMISHDLRFPTGANHMGQFLGDATCLPLPLQERENNPSISS